MRITFLTLLILVVMLAVTATPALASDHGVHLPPWVQTWVIPVNPGPGH